MDIDQYRVSRADKPGASPPKPPPRHKANEWFLKGPIPGVWLSRATGLSGRAVKVGLALWYLAGLTKTRTVKPTWAVWRKFSLSPDAGRHGLAALEEAGLVTVERHRGRCPMVTILELSQKTD